MYFIDVQGTLIEDHTKQPIRGAIEFIDHLNQSATPYMVITNSTKYPSIEFLGYLNSIGLNIPQSHYLDPLMVLEEYIAKEESIAAYGTKAFISVLSSMGYILNYDSPDVVLIAIKEDFSPDEYAQMIEFLLSGSRLIGMHETSLYAKNHKRYPGVGAILKMLEFATQASYSVVGKPSTPFFQAALKGLNQQGTTYQFKDITIISDDVTGDILPAQKMGMKGVFVLSGKYRDEEEIVPNLKEKPHAIYSDIHAVLETL